ncbi:hypothetical protein QNH36_08030 [Mesobacillus sp. AQ2]|jgi:hypothetical protein|uniref:hypothetical protein n=1 Tax=unclassified Mesobacillus TaxID=2675270 RepID=UPI0020405F48|nr:MULTISPECIES: hypothetical protein [unclassified Mesobacillus]MCM3123523.1 hypothetical protein [Mesobacillus sp. MER 33]MCM3232994.1 hypothetical protein [Mesobacillus sp. MER 48]WHX42069.1 hypothetical protein QNH36_08030 [Mesobacillus sp. AQ2]
MNKLVKPIALIGLSAFIISGCGSAEESEKAVKKTPESQQASAPEAANEEQQAAEQEKTNEEGLIRIMEQNLDYTLNGEQKQQTGFLKYNDNQNYSMYVLPDYELTAEEPNKDVLMLTEDDSIFMRIELLPADAEWEMVEENAKAQLAAVGPEVNETEIPEDPFFSNAWGMETKNGADNVTTYLIKNEEQPLKLTLFTKEGSDHRDAFIQMAKTIMKEEK